MKDQLLALLATFDATVQNNEPGEKDEKDETLKDKILALFNTYRTEQNDVPLKDKLLALFNVDPTEQNNVPDEKDEILKEKILALFITDQTEQKNVPGGKKKKNLHGKN